MTFDVLHYTPQRWQLWALKSEFTVLFVVMPVVAYLSRFTLAPILLYVLAVIVAWSVLLLVSDRRFKRFRLWNWSAVKLAMPNVLVSFTIAALFMALMSWYLTPDRFFRMPFDEPNHWLLLIVLYPLLSAWPQELLFRTFLFHRYKRIMRSKKLRVLVSAAVFALAHLLFANWVAVLGSFIAGIVFALTYVQSKSTLLVAIEHSLWGLWLFTSGLGHHFDSTLLSR